MSTIIIIIIPSAFCFCELVSIVVNRERVGEAGEDPWLDGWRNSEIDYRYISLCVVVDREGSKPM